MNKCKFTKPRPIQAATIPHVLSGKDIVSKAETGSGKTLAFVLPIVDQVRASNLVRYHFSVDY